MLFIHRGGFLPPDCMAKGSQEGGVFVRSRRRNDNIDVDNMLIYVLLDVNDPASLLALEPVARCFAPEAKALPQRL